MSDQVKTDAARESLERRVCYCRGCGARIFYLQTAAGKRIPVDAGTVQPADFVFLAERHRSHFATCPKASEFRRKVKK